MYRRTRTPLAATLVIAALAPMAARAQSAPPPPTIALSAADDLASARVVLKPAYHVRLTSTWPQEITAGGCRNGGEEVVEGTLARDGDGAYAGTFTRRTELLFCGAHGGREGAPSSACALTLTGQGEVDAIGVVMGDETGPTGQEVRLVWTPTPGQSAMVSGECAPEFKEAVRRMYLSTPHAAEFPLTAAGAGPWTARLENYAWAVELE